MRPVLHSPLAGACLRPLGHLSGAPRIRQISESARAFQPHRHFVPAFSTVRFRTARNVNETCLCRGLSTWLVQACSGKVRKMIEIPLPCGKVTLVSDEDWPRVRPLSWYDRGGGYVAARYKKSLGGHGRLVPMHRFILAAPAGYVVDHIDGNPLNNQRDNLQITTNSRNLLDDFERIGGDHYDNSVWIRGVSESVRLSEAAVTWLLDHCGFSKVYVYHTDGWETHYSADTRRGWRRRYVRDPDATTTNVIAGPPDPGYYEISYWPEGWKHTEWLETGYMRIVPDPLTTPSSPPA